MFLMHSQKECLTYIFFVTPLFLLGSVNVTYKRKFKNKKVKLCLKNEAAYL